jgi:hypothetical protein
MNAALITNAPALAYVKEWNAWIVVNNDSLRSLHVVFNRVELFPWNSCLTQYLLQAFIPVPVHTG